MDDDVDDEKKLLPHTANEDIYETLLISVLEVTKLPKELQIMIVGYVDFTADCYADFHAFVAKIREMMRNPDSISIVVEAREPTNGDSADNIYTLCVPLDSVLKTHDVPPSSQELSKLFLRSKKSFRVVQLNQVLSDETRAHILTTVLPFVHQRASLRFSPGLHPKAKLQDSKRILDTHRILTRLCQLHVTLLCLASTAGIGYLLYIWLGAGGLFFLFLASACMGVLFGTVWKGCVSLQQGCAATITQTWVWGLEENEDFRETLEDVVAQAQFSK